MIRTIQSIALLTIVAAGVLFGPTKVSAHADYERSVPDRNEVLAESPSRVDVWFTQEVFKRQGANFVRVFDDQQVQVSEGDGVVDDDDRTHIYTTLPADLPDGRYIVRWMTTSDEDGDTDEGAFCFYVGLEPTAEQQAECTELSGQEATPTSAATTQAAALATPTGSAPDDAADEDDGGAPIAAIVGGVLAGIAAAVVILGGVVLWRRSASA